MNDPIYIAHHGIKGQKWGVRRFQNEDGTRTAAGKAREREGSSESGKNAFSAKAAAHKVAAKVYSINQKTYAKSNKTLSSMNEAAKNEQLKKAAAAQEAANKKAAERQEKVSELKSKASNVGNELKKMRSEDKAAGRQLASNAQTLKRSRGAGKKVANFVVNGAFGSQAYNNLRAAGHSKAVSEGAVLASTFLGGPIGRVGLYAITSTNTFAGAEKRIRDKIDK